MILDIILILIIAVCTAIGIKRGFVKSLCNVLSFIVSVIVALVSYKYITEWIATSPIGKFVSGKLSESIGASAMDFSALPEFLRKPVESGAMEMVDIIAQNLTALIIAVISVIITIVAVKLLIRLIIKILDLFAKLPVIKQCNKLLGCVFGLVSGCFWAALVIFACKYLSYIPAAGFLQELIQDSTVVTLITDIDVLSRLLDGVRR